MNNPLLNNEKTGLLNLILLIFSVLLSLFFPVSTFVWAYAILGPLHYLTQLNWLYNRPIYSLNRSFGYLLIGISVLATLIFLAQYFNLLTLDWLSYVNISACLIILAILLTLKYILKLKWSVILIILIPVVIIAYFFSSNYYYLILFGILLTSVIHVYIFTLFHMISGALKTKNIIDFINSFLMIITPIIIYLIPVPSVQFDYIDSNDFIKDIINNLSYFMGYKNVTVTSFVKLAWFVSFSYLYHYLNWFSKTKIIQWDSSLTRKKTIIFCSISLCCSLIFLIKFEYGLIATLLLSYLHVFAEFPLNYHSIMNIYRAIFSQAK